MGDKYIRTYTSHCMICGSPVRMHALVCKRCRDAGEHAHRPKTENEHQIALINAYARAKGMSYGQYIGKYGS